MSSLTIGDYYVGIICALHSELAAVQAMLDEEHCTTIVQDMSDHNAYLFGRIHRHNVVIASLPAGVDGLTAAATVAKDMSRTFHQLRFGLLVGIGGGIPDLDRGVDIRLGDIVISEPTGTAGGVVQYDKGKSTTGRGWERKGMLNAPPTVLLTALQRLKARHQMVDSVVPALIANMLERYPKMGRTGYGLPGQDQDSLKYAIQDTDESGILIYNHKTVRRPQRATIDPEIHYGTIASGNQVVKDAALRDYIREDCGARCVEMEAAGLMNDFPCLVIRGICDYADEYKNDNWHRYAAATAAAYAKEFLSYVSADQTKQEKPVQQILDVLTEHVKQSQVHYAQHEAHLQKQEINYQSNRHRDCHRAFKTSKYEDHKNINQDPAPGTCRWLLNHPKYQKWQENQHSDLLWISADPGCGKSVLAKLLVNQSLRCNTGEPNPTTCYFFFKDNNEQDNLAKALCALLHQLFAGHPGLIRHALPAWDKNGSQITSEVEELWRIFQSAAADQEIRHLVCVLDALDECRDADRRRLISMLGNFYNDATSLPCSGNGGNIKFLMTSRPYEDIEHHFGRSVASLPSIRVRGEDENDQIHNEIDVVVRHHVKDIVEEFKLTPKTAKRLEEKLLAMEHRTYLWLHLAVASIRQRYSDSLRPEKESIDLLPSSVEDAYELILGRIDQEQGGKVRTIFRIILGARQPLTIGQMTLALDVATTKPMPNALSDLVMSPDRLEKQIRHWCGLFVFINHSRIYLIHQTAKEFLLNDPQQTLLSNDKWKHCLSKTDIEYEMASIYVHYLCLEDFEQNQTTQELDYPGDINIHTRSEGHVQQREHSIQELFKLAAEYWADHWRNIEVVAKNDIKDKAWILYNSESQRFLRWSDIMWRKQNRNRITYEAKSLVLAAYNGHFSIVHRILETNLQDLEITDGDGYTALSRGAEKGHYDIVEMLLQRGADVNAQGGNYVTALLAASSEGHEQVVKLLLENGADVNVQARYYGNALQAASFRGHEQVVKLLLEKGAHVNAQGGKHDNALYGASDQGHEQVVKLLLEKGADVNTQGGRYGNALQAASFRGHEQVVKLLLEKGAHINAQGGRYGNALQAASLEGHEQVVKLLLKKGAHINAQGGRYGNALQAASFRGHEQVVKLLLKKGAHINAQGGRYGNALQAASLEGHEQVVKLLLEKGAHINAQGGRYGNALQAASFSVHEQVVKLLLKKGAHINAQGGRYGNALQAASLEGHEQVVKLLLEKGAHINAQGGRYGNALQAASFSVHEQVVKLLLKKGADVNAQGGKFGNALTAAFSMGHNDVAQLLIDSGASLMPCQSIV